MDRQTSTLKLLYAIAYHIGLFHLFYFLKRKQQTVITYHNAGFLNYEADKKNVYSLGRMSLGEEKDKYFIEAKLCGFERALKKTLIKFQSILDRFA